MTGPSVRRQYGPSARRDVTPQGCFKSAFTANDTTTTLYAPGVPTETTPSGNGSHRLAESGTALIVQPILTATEDQDVRISITGWTPFSTSTDSATNVMWVPSTIAQLDCMAGGQSAASAAAVFPFSAGTFFADVITIASGTERVPELNDYAGVGKLGAIDHAPGAGATTVDGAAQVRLLLHGEHYITFAVDIDGGAGTANASGNALWMVI